MLYRFFDYSAHFPSLALSYFHFHFLHRLQEWKIVDFHTTGFVPLGGARDIRVKKWHV
jgi:hypothetical protein